MMNNSFEIWGEIDGETVALMHISANAFTDDRWNVTVRDQGIVMWDEPVDKVNRYIDAWVASMANVFEFLNGKGHVCVLHNVGKHAYKINKKGGYEIYAE